MATVSRRTSSSRCWPGLLTAAYLCAIVLWIDGMLGCAGQRPKNIGTKKRDVYIAGFFPYGSHVPESHIGRGVMPSVKLAVDHINENRRVLKNYRLHMWWNDTEVSARHFIYSTFTCVILHPCCCSWAVCEQSANYVHQQRELLRAASEVVSEHCSSGRRIKGTLKGFFATVLHTFRSRIVDEQFWPGWIQHKREISYKRRDNTRLRRLKIAFRIACFSNLIFISH